MNIHQAGIHRINQYTFVTEDLLGKGATGQVYLGQDMNNGKKVAIKIIDMRKINNQVTQYLLNNEKKALSMLKNSNIIETVDIIQQNQYCYIITEYCNSGTLQDIIKSKGRLSQKQAFHYFRQILYGYRACAQFGIIHRDLKPSNILIHEGIPKISDFGYCQINGSEKPKMYYNVGSPSYMAPEVYVKNMYGIKSDIWSLGVILFEMLMGRTFDQNMKLMEAVYKIKNEGVPYDSNVSPFAKNIIDACLDLDPVRRITLQQLIQKLSKKQKSKGTLINKQQNVKNFSHPPQMLKQAVFNSPPPVRERNISVQERLPTQKDKSKLFRNPYQTPVMRYNQFEDVKSNHKVIMHSESNQKILSENALKQIYPPCQYMIPVPPTVNMPRQNLVRSVIIENYAQNIQKPFIKKFENKNLIQKFQSVDGLPKSLLNANKFPNDFQKSVTPKSMNIFMSQVVPSNFPLSQKTIYFPEPKLIKQKHFDGRITFSRY